MKDIFEAAKLYNFKAIKEHVDTGGDINVCDESGSSVLTYLIEAYLEEEHSREKESKKEMLSNHDECDYEFWDSYTFDYQATPLDKRECAIKEELDYLFEHGVDPNLCEIVDGDAETPLYITVCVFQDYYLTKYLLEHGADPGVWLFDDSKIFGYKQEPFLMDDLDIAIMNGAKGKKVENIVERAQLLWEYGMKDWGGFCIDVDQEKGVIGHHPLRVKW